MDDEDLLSEDAVSEPVSAYRRLAGATGGAPVWHTRWAGWIVTRHADVAAVLQSGSISSRAFARLEELDPEAPRRWPEVFRILASSMVCRDPPDHTRLRGLISKAFTRRAVESMRPRIAALSAELLEAARARGVIDLVADFAAPLPIRVIAEMIGACPEDGAQLKVWSDDIARLMLGSLADASRHTTANAALAEMSAYFQAVIRTRRTTPRDDLASALLAARERDDSLTEDDVVAMCSLLVFAGHETTTNLIANAVLALLDHPDQLTRARHGLPLEAIDELVRYDGPMKALSRLATEEVDLAGCRVRRGERLLLALAAANRDPARFVDPDRLDLGRRDNPHLAFGYAAHYCIGAPLAKLEAQIALQTLLQCFPALELAVPRAALRWHPALLVRALTSLPIALTGNAA